MVVAEKPWGTCYRVKGYPIAARTVSVISDLTARAKKVLRERGVRFTTVEAGIMTDS